MDTVRFTEMAPGPVQEFLERLSVALSRVPRCRSAMSANGCIADGNCSFGGLRVLTHSRNGVCAPQLLKQFDFNEAARNLHFKYATLADVRANMLNNFGESDAGLSATRFRS
jgi:hypothetical protein